MNSTFENSMSRIAEQAQDRYRNLLEGAQKGVHKAAGRVSRGKKPVKTLSRMGLKLTAVGHRTADKVLKQNTKLVENQIDAFADRLQAVAEATDVRSLVEEQVRMIPENASRLVNDTRNTLSIVADAGSEVKSVFTGAFNELRGATPAKKKAVKRTPKKTAVSKPAATKSQAA